MEDEDYWGTICQIYLHVHTNYGNWVITKEATCYETGTRYRVCTECNYKLEDTIPPSHSYSNGVCTVCGLVCDPHSWVFGSCMICGYQCSHNFVDDVCTICGYKNPTCITEGTLITLANGEQVAVEELTGEEKLLVWNLETGAYDEAEIAYIIDHEGERAERDIIHLYFSDGTDIEVIYDHGFYDLDLNKLIYINENNYKKYIGHWFVTQNVGSENKRNKVQLTEVKIENRKTVAYEVVTYEHLTCFTNGLLSISSLLNPFCNIFEVEKDSLSYNKAQMAEDIEKYGLFTYEDFKDKIPEYAFKLYHVDYLKVALGKGLTTWEEIEYLIKYYNVEIEPIVQEGIKTKETNLLSVWNKLIDML